MAPTYRIEIDELDLGQILDGMEIRAESWQRTAEYLRTGEMPAGEFFIVEECSKPDEAEGIAEHYRSIVRKIRTQMETQT
jgi:hypothetical protein